MGEAHKTVEEFKVEVIGGKQIIMMSPAFSNHNLVKDNVLSLFRAYLKGHICIPIGDGHKLVLEEGGYVIPDFFVLCDRSKRRKDGVYGAPDLIVEVLSLSTREYDKGEKKDLYERSGVKEYWLIEPDLRIIETYFLRDGRYVLNGVYGIPDELEAEEDKVKIAQEFKVGIFPELLIKLEDVFEYVINW